MRVSPLAMKPPLLVCAQSLGPNLSAHQVAAAIERGLGGGGLAAPYIVEPPFELRSAAFQKRIRAAFAIVICAEHLSGERFGATQPGAIATDARQAGVACHAICARNDLD